MSEDKKSKYDNQFKFRYVSTMVRVMNELFGIICETEESIHRERQQIQKKNLRGFFVKIGLYMQISTQEAKDYYNNKWVRQFFEKLNKDNKKYIKQVIEANQELDNTQIYKIVKLHLPSTQFNKQSVYQYIAGQRNDYQDKYKQRLLFKNNEHRQQMAYKLEQFLKNISWQ